MPMIPVRSLSPTVPIPFDMCAEIAYITGMNAVAEKPDALLTYDYDAATRTITISCCTISLTGSWIAANLRNPTIRLRYLFGHPEIRLGKRAG